MRKIKAKFLFVMFLIFIGVIPVNADTLTLDDIAKQLENSDVYNYLNNDETSVEIVKDVSFIEITYNTIDSGTWVTTFNYENDILSYSFPGDKTADTTFAQIIIDSQWIKEILFIVAKANGYTDEQLQSIDEEVAATFTLEKNGYESTEFTYSNGSSITATGCDTFKININNLKLDIPEDISVVPTIEILDSKHDSVTIKVFVEGLEESMCNLYRATNDSDYEYVTKISCSGENQYIDKNVAEKTTYYYKAVIDGGNNYSKVVTAIVPSKPTVEAIKGYNKPVNPDEGVENPETGIILSIVIMLSMLIISLMLVVYYYRKIQKNSVQ